MLFLSNDAGIYWPYALMILGMNANRAEDMMNDMGNFFLSCCAFTIMFFLIANLLLIRRDVRT